MLESLCLTVSILNGWNNSFLFFTLFIQIQDHWLLPLGDHQKFIFINSQQVKIIRFEKGSVRICSLPSSVDDLFHNSQETSLFLAIMS